MFIAPYNQLALSGRSLMMKSVALHRLICPPTAHGYVSELFVILVKMPLELFGILINTITTLSSLAMIKLLASRVIELCYHLNFELLARS